MTITPIEDSEVCVSKVISFCSCMCIYENVDAINIWRAIYDA